jgi:uncharacterized protein YllA (UPF0747 family)
MLEVARAERKIVQHVKRNDAGLTGGARLARNHLRPLGQPQERVLSIFQYLPRHPGLLRELAQAMTVRLRDEP